jgi:hypothetical protein
MRPTLEVEMPLCRAMLCVLQCVASGRWLSSVCTMTLSTLLSSILRGAPGRGSSSNPSRPCSTKRWRHLPTVLRCHLLARRHRLVAQTRRAAQHDPRPQRQSLRRLAPLRIAFQNPGNLDRQLDPRHRAARPHPLAPAATAPRQFIKRISGSGTLEPNAQQDRGLCRAKQIMIRHPLAERNLLAVNASQSLPLLLKLSLVMRLFRLDSVYKGRYIL